MKTKIKILTAAMCLLIKIGITIESANAFVHPGILHTQADIDRMMARVNADESPWIDSWNRLINNSHAQLNYTPDPQEYVCCGGNGCPDGESFIQLANDCAAAYQCALRYRISGDMAYAEKAIQIMNRWVETFIEFTGDSNMKLRAGLYGYQFAAAAELMRGYSGWSSTDFNNFKDMMLNKFYIPHNRDFLDRHNGTCFDHYWANWDLANMTSCLAIAILCDDQDKFDHAIEYFKSGIGTGQIDRLVNNLYDGDPVLGQCQESGRDQGHATLCISLIGAFCQIAYNQGQDMFAYKNNKVLALCEYTAKYNLGLSVPFTTYTNCENNTMTEISSEGRGTARPSWELIYNHYVNIKGLHAPYSQQWASDVRPEGGGGDYGSTSGSFDQLGFGTLTYTVDNSCSPTPVTPFIQVDGGSWQQTSSVTIDAGSSITFGPRPSEDSYTWSGCGLEGASSSDNQTITPSASCLVMAAYTNSCGTQTTQMFDIRVNANIEAGQTYVISAQHSNQSIDVASGSTLEGANILQWPYEGATNQQWVVADAGDGYYKLQSVKSNMYIDVDGASSSDGANVIQWNSTSGTNQQFQIVDAGNGYYTIRPRHSGKCLEVADNSTSNGANIQQWTCNEGSNQNWVFETVNLKSAGTIVNKKDNAHTVLYPNPATDKLQILNSIGAAIEIYNDLGRLVLKNKIEQTGQTIDITGLNSGVYFVRINNNGTIINEKLVKK